MNDISSQTPVASTSPHETIVELSMRRDVAKRMGGIWIQKAAAEYVHAKTIKDIGDLARADELERRGALYQQRASDCWAAVAKLNSLLLELRIPPLVPMNAGTHPDYVCSTEKGIKVSDQIESAVRDIEHALRPFDSP